MALAFLSLLGVVAARIRGQHQLVMGQKQSSEVAVSATADAQIDIEDRTGRFRNKSNKKWLYCPDISPSNKVDAAYCEFTSNPALANAWKMTKGKDGHDGWRDDVQQYQFIDQGTGRCLMRQSCHSSTSAMSLADPTRWYGNKNCKHCGTLHWQYNHKRSRLAEDSNRNCIQNDARIRHCTDGHAKLEFVPGFYKPPPPEPKTFKCITQSESIAKKQAKRRTEEENAMLIFEEQMVNLERQSHKAEAKAQKLGVASGILGVLSGGLGAIPVVGGVVSFLTTAAGKATECAAAAAYSRADQARHESIHIHMDKIERQIKGSTAEIKAALAQVREASKKVKVALEIAAISQYFLDMQIAAREIAEIRWHPADLVRHPGGIKGAYGQVRITYETAFKVNQFLASMRECIMGGDGQLVEQDQDIRVVTAHKNSISSEVGRLQSQLSALRTLKALCETERQRDKEQKVLKANLERQQREMAAIRKADQERRAKEAADKQHRQDIDGFDSNSEGVDCTEYTFVDACANVKGGKTECEKRCTNRHVLYVIEKSQRYRCRWQGEGKGCRSSAGEKANQKCKPTTCEKPK